MSNKRFFYPHIVNILIIIYILISFSILGTNVTILQATIHEDSYFEGIGAAGFFITAILFLICSKMVRKMNRKGKWTWFVPIAFIGLAVLFLFGAGEEISWGQRIFKFVTPDSLSTLNRQDEFNLHNFEIIDAGQFISVDRLFDIFWFTFTVIFPVVYLIFPSIRDGLEKLLGKIIPIPHWNFGVLFFINYFWAKVAKAFFSSRYTYDLIPFVQAVQEIKESNYSILFTFVGLYFILIIQQKKS
jgi:hypothetical protein